MAALIASYLLLVFLVPVALSAAVTWRALPRNRRCPQCGSDTAALHGRWPLAGRGPLARLGVGRRWCMQCSWEGFARVAPLPLPAPLREPPQVEREGDVPVLALDVRSLRLDGRLWRVQLQWWREPERCHGRLVFIEPSGRRVRDGLQAFSGATQFEVLGQALSLPDRQLASRLRQLLAPDS